MKYIKSKTLIHVNMVLQLEFIQAYAYIIQGYYTVALQMTVALVLSFPQNHIMTKMISGTVCYPYFPRLLVVQQRSLRAYRNA